MNSEMPVDALFGIPKDYVYLLIGMGIGFLLGWLSARMTGGGPREIGHAPEPQEGVQANRAAPPSINLVVNRKSLDLDPAQAAEIQGLIREKKMVDAIKRLREVTGLGLAEAKAVAESLAKVDR